MADAEATKSFTWTMARDVSLLDRALARRPRCLMLSFADPELFAIRVHAAKIPLVCQMQPLEQAFVIKEGHFPCPTDGKKQVNFASSRRLQVWGASARGFLRTEITTRQRIWTQSHHINGQCVYRAPTAS